MHVHLYTCAVGILRFVSGRQCIMRHSKWDVGGCMGQLPNNILCAHRRLPFSMDSPPSSPRSHHKRSVSLGVFGILPGLGPKDATGTSETSASAASAVQASSRPVIQHHHGMSVGSAADAQRPLVRAAPSADLQSTLDAKPLMPTHSLPAPVRPAASKTVGSGRDAMLAAALKQKHLEAGMLQPGSPLITAMYAQDSMSEKDHPHDLDSLQACSSVDAGGARLPRVSSTDMPVQQGSAAHCSRAPGVTPTAWIAAPQLDGHGPAASTGGASAGRGAQTTADLASSPRQTGDRPPREQQPHMQDPQGPASNPPGPAVPAGSIPLLEDGDDGSLMGSMRGTLDQQLNYEPSSLVAPLYDLVDTVFELSALGFFRRQVSVMALHPRTDGCSISAVRTGAAGSSNSCASCLIWLRARAGHHGGASSADTAGRRAY